MNFLYFEKNNIIKYDFPLNTVCSMKTGGKSRYAFFPESREQLSEVVIFLRENKIKFIVLGSGSNTVFSDSGYNGAVIFTTGMKSFSDVTDKLRSDNACGCELCEKYFYVSAGYSLTSLASKLSRSGYSGLEFAYGIPASLGGAVYMNAGAYGGEIKDVIYSVEYLDSDGNFKILLNDSEKEYFGYRYSIFMENKDNIITGVVLKLKKAEDYNPMTVAEKNMSARKEKQPLEYPSCGSAFKRPVGHYAGALIEQAGLKGFHIGGAYVSEKHAGFIVNKGGATTKDVTDLIDYVKNKVFETSGVLLEPEIKIVEE